MSSDIGTRMKRYEAVYDYKLTPRSCVVIRVDGRAFHTYLRHAEKPFDLSVINAMTEAMQKTATGMQGLKVAYCQSDEISFLITDFDTLNTQGWFDYELSKIISISASTVTAYFNRTYEVDRVATFDARAFIIPHDDVPNYFIWRQRDWERNSLHMYARSFFSHKELHNKDREEVHEMLHTEDANWANLEDKLKNGTFVWADGMLSHDKETYESLKDKLETQGLTI